MFKIKFVLRCGVLISAQRTDRPPVFVDVLELYLFVFVGPSAHRHRSCCEKKRAVRLVVVNQAWANARADCCFAIAA